MRRKKIGEMHFEGKIQVTDPCYAEDVWCRSIIDVIPGNYFCYVFHNTDKYVVEDESGSKLVSDTRVGIIGIYLNGAIPPQKTMIEEKQIGVDAGLAGFFMKKPDYTDEQWDDFCNIVCEKNCSKDAWIFNDRINTVGFFSTSGYGDGVYPVYVARNPKGEIYAAEIRFL